MSGELLKSCFFVKAPERLLGMNLDKDAKATEAIHNVRN